METLAAIQRRIGQAAARAGRDPGSIRLVGVTKGQPAEKIRPAVAAGLLDFGENYAQELLEHRAAVGSVSPLVRWHFIGHLQRNKVRQVLPIVDWIHSVDSLALAQEIDRRVTDKIPKILIEVRLGGEETKTGIRPEDLEPLVIQMNRLQNISLEGLMTLPPFFEDPEKVRPYFRQLREIRDAINQKKSYRNPLQHLSMGMTHDFETAIEEGSTIVRIGTGLFGERKR